MIASRQRAMSIATSNRTSTSNEDLAACHALLNIPANPEYETLNLAQAVQIVCYELRMATGPAIRRLAPDAPPAVAEDLAHLRGHLGRVLRRLGFPEHPNAAQIEARVMRLVHRAVPDEKEVQILRGVLSAVEQALDREDAR